MSESKYGSERKSEDGKGGYSADEKCGGYEDYDSKSQAKDEMILPVPNIEITDIKIDGSKRLVTDPIDLSITFEVDRDVVCAHWVVKLLVDTAEARLIKILGETAVEDYPEGESDMRFYVDSVEVDGIPRSTIANSGLLIATFMADGEEVAGVNLVTNVYVEGEQVMREILNPLE